MERWDALAPHIRVGIGSTFPCKMEQQPPLISSSLLLTILQEVSDLWHYQTCLKSVHDKCFYRCCVHTYLDIKKNSLKFCFSLNIYSNGLLYNIINTDITDIVTPFSVFLFLMLCIIIIIII